MRLIISNWATPSDVDHQREEADNGLEDLALPVYSMHASIDEAFRAAVDEYLEVYELYAADQLPVLKAVRVNADTIIAVDEDGEHHFMLRFCVHTINVNLTAK